MAESGFSAVILVLCAQCFLCFLSYFILDKMGSLTMRNLGTQKKHLLNVISIFILIFFVLLIPSLPAILAGSKIVAVEKQSIALLALFFSITHFIFLFKVKKKYPKAFDLSVNR